MRSSLRRQRGFIYLRTGTNGVGKTLLTIKDVRELQLQESRPVYYFNIKLKGAALTWGWIERDPREWQQFPFGSIILGDEAHKYFPKRRGNDPEPAYVVALAEHRAEGKDFFFLTQHPADLDIFIRRRIGSPGWHQHLKRRSGAELVSVLEWPTCKDDPEKQGSSLSALVTTRPFPREYYAYYDSAVMHTAKLRIPRQVWYMAAALVVCIASLWFGVASLFGHSSGKRVEQDPAQIQAAGPGRAAVGAITGPGGDHKPPMTAEAYVASYKPRVPGLAYTAPAYDGLTAPVKVPLPAACMDWAKRGCHCFTQEGTPYDASPELCRQIVSQGIFLPFVEGASRPAPSPAAAASAPKAAAPVPSVVSLSS